MKTIEERAYEYALAEAQVEGFDFGSVKDGYIKGATDQRKIDIDNTCEWLTERLQFGCHPCNGINLVKEFRKAMEE